MLTSQSLKKPRLFRRLLLKGIAFSLFFHIGLVLLFQIKKPFLGDETSAPSTVFISPIESCVTFLPERRLQDEDPRVLYAREFRLPNALTQDPPEAASLPQALLSSTNFSNKAAAIQPILPWSFTDEYAPSEQPCRAYPIKTTLHSMLRHLSIIDDGSSLFKKSSVQTLLNAPLFTEPTAKIDFAVNISPSTGKIQKAICLKEPYDKRFQTIASRLLRKMQFHTGGIALEKNVWTGTISIQFYGTFEKIVSLLEMEESQ